MEEDGYKVSLNVYDLSQGLARQLSTTFLGKVIDGIWHTGVVVYGNEYFFGGGIQHLPAGTTPYGTPVKVFDLGITHVPKGLFEEYLQEISPRYTAETYDLLRHNCNNFSNEVAQFLVGTTIPNYILELPNEVMNSPMGAMILPMIQRLEMTMRQGAVPQAPQFMAPAMNQVHQPMTASSAPKASAVSTAMNAAAKPIEETRNDSASGKPENCDRGIADVGKASEKPPAAVKPGREENMVNEEVVDPLGKARSRVQEEIVNEFAAIMATGTLRASEAAALATRRVMERHGRLNITMPQS